MSVVTYDGQAGVALAVIDRADARNAINADVREGVLTAFKQFAADQHARVLVLASQGPVFCAGGDLAEMAALGTAMIPRNYVPSIQIGRAHV